MQENTTLGKLEDRIPYWGLPAGAIALGLVLYVFNDAIRSYVAMHWSVPLSTVPDYSLIGIAVLIGGLLLFLRRRRYI